MKKGSFLFKLASFFTAFVFLTVNLCYSALIDPKTFSLPADIGNVDDLYLGENNFVSVILIEDAHSIADAQKSISALLGYLDEKYGLAEIGLEGGVGDIIVDDVRLFPNKTVIKNLSRKLLKEGVINGAIHYALNSPVSKHLFGLEEKESYLANYRAYLDLSAGVKENEEAISFLKRAIDKLIDEELDRKSKYLYGLYKEYRNDFNKAGELVLSLAEFCPLDEKCDVYPVLALFAELAQLKDSFDEHKALREMRELKAEMGIDIVGNPVYLKNLAVARGVELKDYADFVSYVKYLEKLGAIDYGELLDEIDRFCRDFFLSVSNGKDAGRIALFYDSYIRALKISAKRDDLSFLRCNFNSDIENFIREIEIKTGISFSPLYIGIYKDLFAKALSFYKLAEKRDLLMVQNLCKKIKSDIGKPFCVVTGGYHSGGIKEALKNQGISYMAIAPKIGNISDRLPYEELMLSGIFIPDTEQGFRTSSTLALPVQFSPIVNSLKGKGSEAGIRHYLYSSMVIEAEKLGDHDGVEKFFKAIAGNDEKLFKLLDEALSYPEEKRLYAVERVIEKIFEDAGMSELIISKTKILALALLPVLTSCARLGVSLSHVNSELKEKTGGTRIAVEDKNDIKFKELREKLGHKDGFENWLKKLIIRNRKNIKRPMGRKVVEKTVLAYRRRIRGINDGIIALIKENERRKKLITLFAENLSKKKSIAYVSGIGAGMGGILALANKKKIDRRKFLKLSGLAALSAVASKFVPFGDRNIFGAERIVSDMVYYTDGVFLLNDASSGVPAYSDADFLIRDIPSHIAGGDLIQTPMAETYNENETVCEFTLLEDSDVYIALFPLAGGVLPHFMDGYVYTGMSVGVEFGEYGVLDIPLYRKSYYAGDKVSVGGALNGGNSFSEAAANYVIIVKKRDSIVTNLVSVTGNRYEVSAPLLQSGCYSDADYTLEEVPYELNNALLVKTPIADTFSTVSGVASFDLEKKGEVYIASFPLEGGGNPLFMDEFEAVGKSIKVKFGEYILEMPLYKKVFEAGSSVVLGGALEGGRSYAGATANYIVFVKDYNDIIGNIVPYDGANYEKGACKIDAECYSDAPYKLKEFPEFLNEAEILKTPISQTYSEASMTAEFYLNSDAELYVALFPLSGGALPEFMSGFEYTGKFIGVEFGNYGILQMPLYKKVYSVGSKIDLSGALYGGLDYEDAAANYILFAKRYEEISYDIVSYSGALYSKDIAASGKRLFSDAGYFISSIPPVLDGAEMIKTPINDVNNRSDELFSFKVNRFTDVYVAVMPMENGDYPSFLDGYEPVGEYLYVNFGDYGDIPMQLYKKSYMPNEEVSFGGILSEGGVFKYGISNYVVFVKETGLIRDIISRSSSPIETEQIGEGISVYGDASYSLREYPAELEGSILIKTSYLDTFNADSELISFTANEDIDLYIAAFPLENNRIPDFMSGFEPVSKSLRVEFGEYGSLEMALFKKHFVKGERVILDGYLNGGSSYLDAASNYFLAAKSSSGRIFDVKSGTNGIYLKGRALSGRNIYSDSDSCKVSVLPDLLNGAEMIMTPLADSAEADPVVAAFNIASGSDLYIAIPPVEGDEKPIFMQDFNDTGMTVSVNNNGDMIEMKLYRKAFPEGGKFLAGGILYGGINLLKNMNYIIFAKKHKFSPNNDIEYETSVVNEVYKFTIGVYDTGSEKRVVLVDNENDAVVVDAEMPKDPDTGEYFEYDGSALFKEIKLAWDYDSTSVVDGFKIYKVKEVGYQTGDPHDRLCDRTVCLGGDARKDSYYINDLGHVIFHATAFNSAGESQLSNPAAVDMTEEMYSDSSLYTFYKESDTAFSLMVIRFNLEEASIGLVEKFDVEKDIVKRADIIDEEGSQDELPASVLPGAVIPEKVLFAVKGGKDRISENDIFAENFEEDICKTVSKRFIDTYNKAVELNKYLLEKYGELFSFPSSDIKVKTGGLKFAQFNIRKEVEIFERLLKKYDGDSDNGEVYRFMFAMWHEADENKYDSHKEIFSRDLNRLAVLRNIGVDVRQIIGIEGFELYEKFYAAVDDMAIRFEVFNDASEYEKIHRENIRLSSETHIVVIKGKQILENKANIAADIKYHIKNSVSNGNKLIVLVRGKDEEESVKKYLEQEGIPLGIQALGIEYRDGSYFDISSGKNEKELSRLTYVIDKGEIIPDGANAVLYNSYLPDIVTLAFKISRNGGRFDASRYVNVKFENGIYEIAGQIADMMKRAVAARAMEISA